MSDLLTLIGQHGYAILFGAVFAEAIGLPLPAALVLVVGGAAAASGVLSYPLVPGVALVALMLGDSLLYLLGRYTGWGLLGFLCRVSVNPETCILRAAESFYKRGKATLIFAKFIPGINTMAPPLAGSMKMRVGQFLRLDLVGACLYAFSYSALGFVFHDFLEAITRSIRQTGQVVEIVLLLALLAYIGHRAWQYWTHRAYRVVPRVQVEELANRLASGERSRILMADVRSHGYYDADAERIRGSIRIEPNNLSEEIKALAREKDIYLYCT